MPKLGGVILAAGASSRMGRDKALLPWPPGSTSGETLLSAGIAALKPLARTVLVVGGANVEALAPITAASGALLVRNPAPERGQFSSLQTGLRAMLDHGCIAAMIMPVDCAPLSAASLHRLCRAFDEAIAGGAWAVAPEQRGRRGHPLFAARPLIDAFLNAPVTSNARQVKQGCAERFLYVEIADPLLTVDINTPEQYAAAGEKRSSKL